MKRSCVCFRRFRICRQRLLNPEVGRKEFLQYLTRFATYAGDFDIGEFQRHLSFQLLDDRPHRINQAGFAGKLHLRIDQEVPGGGDILTFLQASKNDHLIVQNRPHHDRTNLETPRFGFHIKHAVASGHQNGRPRHVQRRRLFDGSFRVTVAGRRHQIHSADRTLPRVVADDLRVHGADPAPRKVGVINFTQLPNRQRDGRVGIIAGTQSSRRVKKFHTDSNSSLLRINGRCDKRNSPLEDFPMSRLNFRFHSLSKTNSSRIFRKQLQHQPDGRQIGDAVNGFPRFDVLAFDGHLLNHRAARRSVDRQSRLRFFGGFQRFDLVLAKAKFHELMAGTCHQFLLCLPNRLQCR